MNRESSIDTILGCIVGGAIGDAAGSNAENSANPSPALSLPDTAWYLTDDTQLTLATCEALTDSPHPDPAIIAAAFLRWFRSRRLCGIGASTLKALIDLDAGAHWALSGRKGDQGAGNGAAMRIAPFAFCVDPRTDDSRRLIRDVCRITHHHDEAYVGALAVVLAIWGAANGDWSLDWIASLLPDTSIRDRLLTYAGFSPVMPLAEVARAHGASGFVVESVPFALLAASRVKELGFARMLEQIINAGGDTDTNASIAGQVAGTKLGLSGLPSDLVGRVPDAEMVLEIGRAFAEKVVSRSLPEL